MPPLTATPRNGNYGNIQFDNQISTKPRERQGPEKNSLEIHQIFRRIAILSLEKELHYNREKSLDSSYVLGNEQLKSKIDARATGIRLQKS